MAVPGTSTPVPVISLVGGGTAPLYNNGPGQTITTNGTWTNSPTSYSYQWQVSANGTTGWSSATGAGNTTTTYMVASADQGNYIRCQIYAINGSGTSLSPEYSNVLQVDATTNITVGYATFGAICNLDCYIIQIATVGPPCPTWGNIPLTPALGD